jgi:hypothetical protein
MHNPERGRLDPETDEILRALPFDLAADILEELPPEQHARAIRIAERNLMLAKTYDIFPTMAQSEAEAQIIRRHFPQADVTVGDTCTGYLVRESDPIRCLELYLAAQRDAREGFHS